MVKLNKNMNTLNSMKHMTIMKHKQIKQIMTNMNDELRHLLSTADLTHC